MRSANASRVPHVAWRTLALAFLAYLALAIVQTFPLVLHLPGVMPHDLGDPLLSTGILWWNAHVLPFTERWWNGFAFYPAPGFLAFSDPRLGESLIATPLQWLGLGPVAAYNITFLATYPLSALAAHWLGFVLTRRHDAAAVAGLTYGFCPFRVAHIPHLELLAAFGMPAALAALHLYKETRHQRWLVVFALALILQGLCSSYYLVFFSVLLGLWALWHIRRGDAKALLGIVIAGLCALVALIPLALGYARAHAQNLLERPLNEIVAFSADATSILTAHPTVRLWAWTAQWGKSEGELFPGATIVLLVVAGAYVARRRGGTRDRLDRIALGLLPVSAACAAIAMLAWAYAPWRFEMPGLKIASDSPFKPMTLAVLGIGIWLGASSRVRSAYVRCSPFAFYTAAAVVLFVFSMGPKPAFLGHQFLYQPPYAWLMRISLFESIRVPARFGMLIMLALAAAGSIAFDRLRHRVRPAAGRMLVACVLIGIAADGWSLPLALKPLPAVWSAARAEGFSAVLELPLGDIIEDLAATYRATDHGHLILNGSSGFEPPHYFPLRTALTERDPTALDWLPPTGPILVVVDTRGGAAAEWDRYLRADARVTPLAPDGHWAFYAFRPGPAAAMPCRAAVLPLSSIADDRAPVSMADLTDDDPRTRWFTPHPQRAGDSLLVDLGGVAQPCALTLALGEFRNSYARKLVVESSLDAAAWSIVATQRTAGLTIRAALDDPRQTAVRIPLALRPARFLRLRIDESHPEVPWQVTELQVVGNP